MLKVASQFLLDHSWRGLSETPLFFVWDEVSMAHKHVMTGIDRLFKDLMQDDRPFGVKLVMMSGDFRQSLPIIPGGSEA
jgi:hypothetical protein